MLALHPQVLPFHDYRKVHGRHRWLPSGTDKYSPIRLPTPALQKPRWAVTLTCEPAVCWGLRQGAVFRILLVTARSAAPYWIFSPVEPTGTKWSQTVSEKHSSPGGMCVHRTQLLLIFPGRPNPPQSCAEFLVALPPDRISMI